ncbi:MAG: extracellular solute-binding protein [Clostridia bacterium]|nr:extracellular solute-binding protein [Clostridia bacterium]MBR3274665.1 extracellular solute-binding protein [Clostridia bacterium]
MKKTIIALLLVAAMLCAMPAFAEKAEGWNNVNAEGYQFPDYSGKTLSLMWWGSDTRARMTEEVIHLWEEKTGATVEFEYYDGGTYWTQFQAKMAANDLPDVFQMGNNWLTYYDTIEPLNAWIEDGTIDTTAISEAMLATTINQANGDVTGMSNGTNARCFAYNPAIFDEAGVPYPTDNWTWDDFAAAARKIHETTGNPAITTLEYNSLAFSTVTQWKEGYNFYAMDGSDFAFNGDTEPLAYIFELLTTLQQEGVIADYGIQNEIGQNIEADWIAFGDAAMVMLSSNQFQALSNVAAESGITLELATIPRVHADGQSGMVVRSSQEMSMWKGSEDKDMAANFLNFFVNSIEANRILNCERGVSINSDVLAALKADTELTNEVTAKVYTIIDLIGSMPDAANSSPAEPAANEEISDVLKKTYFQGLAEGKFASAQEAADKFWAEAQEIWAKF